LHAICEQLSLTEILDNWGEYSNQLTRIKNDLCSQTTEYESMLEFHWEVFKLWFCYERRDHHSYAYFL